jgi:hypothetical protein
MPSHLEAKILDKYKGRSIKDAQYALDVASGFYEARAIRVACEKELRRLRK